MVWQTNNFKYFLNSLQRIISSLVFICVFILGEWAILSLIKVTVCEGNTEIFESYPFKIARNLSLWGLAIMWGIHVITEIFLWIKRRLPLNNNGH